MCERDIVLIILADEFIRICMVLCLLAILLCHVESIEKVLPKIKKVTTMTLILGKYWVFPILISILTSTVIIYIIQLAIQTRGLG